MGSKSHELGLSSATFPSKLAGSWIKRKGMAHIWDTVFTPEGKALLSGSFTLFTDISQSPEFSVTFLYFYLQNRVTISPAHSYGLFTRRKHFEFLWGYCKIAPITKFYAIFYDISIDFWILLKMAYFLLACLYYYFIFIRERSRTSIYFFPLPVF